MRFVCSAAAATTRNAHCDEIWWLRHTYTQTTQRTVHEYGERREIKILLDRENEEKNENDRHLFRLEYRISFIFSSVQRNFVRFVLQWLSTSYMIHVFEYLEIRFYSAFSWKFARIQLLLDFFLTIEHTLEPSAISSMVKRQLTSWARISSTHLISSAVSRFNG